MCSGPDRDCNTPDLKYPNRIKAEKELHDVHKAVSCLNLAQLRITNDLRELASSVEMTGSEFGDTSIPIEDPRKESQDSLKAITTEITALIPAIGAVGKLGTFIYK